jgi:hypothetical protein
MAATDVDLSGLIRTANPATEFPIGDQTIQGILTGGGFSLIDFIFFLIGVAFLGSLLMAALKYVTSEGSSDKISQANKRIINSLIGLIITLASFIIIKLAATIFGYGQGSANNILPF